MYNDQVEGVCALAKTPPRPPTARCRRPGNGQFPSTTPGAPFKDVITTNFPDTQRNCGNHDAPHMSPAAPTGDACTIMISQISWSAVFVGVISTFATYLSLNILGTGIGAASLNPGESSGNPEAVILGIGVGIWFLVASIIAYLVGGFASGHFGGKTKESTSDQHGLMTWSLSTLLIFCLLTTAIGGIMGGAYSTLTGRLVAWSRRSARLRRRQSRGAATAAAGNADRLSGLLRSTPA